ncbi:hypothetical protein DPMN_038569 [Dreissena polymorpha]|uniref:Uncharacterized protein n=1 Tax=Dreissena polymorpha TaxID=45954 RepID=A0A9D4MHB9_DREPO|nr:hypothetical protein DPMN_038569 [Dreissena polymorpha]
MAACGLDEGKTRTWVNNITDMMNEGSKILLRLPKIRKAIISHPEPLIWYNKKRLELELLYLKRLNRLVQCIDKNGAVNFSDNTLQAMYTRMFYILKKAQKSMYREGSRIDSLAEICNMMLM